MCVCDTGPFSRLPLTGPGSRDLHRQFLRLPDGAIVEVFGSVASQNIDGRIRISTLLDRAMCMAACLAWSLGKN
jgi:hypothetical protein